MAHMPDIEAETREFLTRQAHGLAGLFAHHDQPATTTPQETPMSRLTQAKTIAEDLAAHVRELAANPLIGAIAEAGLGMVLSPAEVSAVLVLVKSLEGARQTAVPQPVADAAAQQGAQ